MKTRAAVCFGLDQPWETAEVDIDPPRDREVQVAMAVAGLCHSDEHIRDGVIAAPGEVLAALGAASMFPMIGGHEGAGIVEAVGPGVLSLAPGDHVAVSFVPSCGVCDWCASGRQHLCDTGAATLAGPMLSDRTWRHHLDGQPVNRMAQIGAFSEHVVCHETSLVKIDEDIPFDVAALVSCGIATGFGSTVNRGGCRPGEVVVVVGCGGIGSGAVLGAVSAGARAIVAIDPFEFKREQALKTGATHVCESLEAAVPLVTELTRGRMAEVIVLSPGVLDGRLLALALNLASKDGRVVCTAVAPVGGTDIDFSLFELAMYNKAILGCLFGSVSPRVAIPALLELYRAGQLPLNRLITRRYRLDQTAEGYRDLAAGINVRGVIDFSLQV